MHEKVAVASPLTHVMVSRDEMAMFALGILGGRKAYKTVLQSSEAASLELH
jgi:hypothetical protein